MAAPRHPYYPGFLAALFLVLLRIAIGWHFHNEGWEKINATSKGGKSWSAEPFLRASTGPLAPYFRGIVPDVNGLARLDPGRLKMSWREDVERISGHYGFDTDQRAKAQTALRDSEQFADIWFSDREKSEKRRQYIHDLAYVQRVERNPGALAFERERAAAKRKDLDADRLTLTKELDAQGSALREAVAKLATPEQVSASGPSVPPRSTLDWVNDLTTYSVLLIGLCLIVGFLTRLAAVGGAVFLLQIYLSMPPWPGLPTSPRQEGHYFIVDKNMVEMFACLALAFLPTGHWIGLDALFFGRRARSRRVEADEPEHAGGRGRRNRTVT